MPVLFTTAKASILSFSSMANTYPPSPGISLVEYCIAFAKGTQADFPVTLASVDLLSLLKQVHHSFVNQMSENVDLVFDYPSNIPTHVIGDAQRITQCVANLIRNAVKFTEKGCITIRVNLLNQQYLKIHKHKYITTNKTSKHT